MNKDSKELKESLGIVLVLERTSVDNVSATISLKENNEVLFRVKQQYDWLTISKAGFMVLFIMITIVVLYAVIKPLIWVLLPAMLILPFWVILYYFSNLSTIKILTKELKEIGVITNKTNFFSLQSMTKPKIWMLKDTLHSRNDVINFRERYTGELKTEHGSYKIQISHGKDHGEYYYGVGGFEVVDEHNRKILSLQAGKMVQTKKYATKLPPKDFEITILKDLEQVRAVFIVTVLLSLFFKNVH